MAEERIVSPARIVGLIVGLLFFVYLHSGSTVRTEENAGTSGGWTGSIGEEATVVQIDG
jgi:hypothetical protein